MTVVLAATDDGVARAVSTESLDGEDWQVGTGFEGQDVACLVADASDPDLLYAGVGTGQGGVWRSTDAGRTWDRAGLTGVLVRSLATTPAAPGAVWAGTKPPFLHVSRDGGDSWRELEGFRRVPWRRLWFSPAEPPFYQAYVRGLAVSPTDPDVLLAGIEFGAVVRSTDGGRRWSGHRPGAIRDCHALAFHPTDGDYVYEAGAGLRRRAGAVSRYAGERFTGPTAGLERRYGWALAVDPVDPETWYVSAAAGPGRAHGTDGNADAVLARHEPSGRWTTLRSGLASMPYALATHPSLPDTVVMGLRNGEVWVADDRGEAWRRLPLRFPGITGGLVVLPDAVDDRPQNATSTTTGQWSLG